MPTVLCTALSFFIFPDPYCRSGSSDVAAVSSQVLVDFS
jgi:hypothetical protein